MLHHHDRVTHVAQPEQRLKEPPIVPLMESDAGLVQNVQHADQPRTDLRGQPDALAFSAGQRRGGPVQREVVQSDIDQEPQPLANLL